MKDKIGLELFEGDKVQVVNGKDAGTVLHKIRLGRKPFNIEGNVDPKDELKGIIVAECRKVRKIVDAPPKTSSPKTAAPPKFKKTFKK